MTGLGRLGLAILIGLCGGSGSGWAGPGEACRDQAGVAEQTAGIPSGLLLAIGKRESGLADPLTRTVLPWPFTLNIDGSSVYAPSASEAVTIVRLAQARGAHSIDVGCFQISLLHHPDAFPNLEDAFDPAKNAVYAAGFLARLAVRTGTWDQAVADYHSADPIRGTPYRDAVLATWKGLPASLSPGSLTGLSVDTDPRLTTAAAFAARRAGGGALIGSASALPLAPLSFVSYGVHVWMPLSSQNRNQPNAVATLAHGARRLPNVIMPGAWASPAGDHRL